MTRPNDIVLKSGIHLSISRHRPGAAIVLYAPPGHRDRTIDESGLGRYQSWHEPGDGNAEFKGMPVEAVRAYAKLNGGVAAVGDGAMALLKELPCEMYAPPEPAPAVEAPATDSPARPSRTKALMEAGTHDFLGRPLPPGLPVDFLTPVVIEARRVVAEVERPLKPVLGYGDVSARQAALEWRAEQASSAASRLNLLECAQYVRHPLRPEAIALRKRLAKAEAQALAEIAREA